MAMDTQDEFIDCKCPHCGVEACFRRDVAGMVEECPECAETLVVPKDAAKVAGVLPLPVTMPRVFLRRPRPLDWKDLLEFLGDPELYAYMNVTPQTEERLVTWLDENQWVKLTTPQATFGFVIEQVSDKKVIGIIYFSFIRVTESRQQGSFTIYVSPKFQRQGFGTEALEGLLDFCFNGISLHRISTACNTENHASTGLLKKVGMRREGEFLQDEMLNGAWANTAYYAMLAEEYAKARRGA